VIASDCKPQKKLIEKYGFGIVYKNIEELKAGIIRLSEDPVLRSEMGEKGYQAIIREFNTESLKHNLLDLYRKLVPKPEKN
jgi:glycosyltransferase involved in cell wall biosynthesis